MIRMKKVKEWLELFFGEWFGYTSIILLILSWALVVAGMLLMI
jgi:hypothetical protein